MRSFVPAALAALAAFSALAIGTDEASARGSALRWKLNIDPDTAARRNPSGRIELETSRGRQVYWYCVYSVKSTHDEPIPMQLNVTATSDASDAVFNEGYYPLALAEVRKRFGDDVMDNLALDAHALEPGQTVRAVSIFQLFEPNSKKFEERVNNLTMKFDGYADPVKRSKLEHSLETIQLWMHFEKKGDQYNPGREPVTFKRKEEKVLSG